MKNVGEKLTCVHAALPH